MSDTFFITGLPRSRTAWFSCFLSSDSYFCEHEASAKYTIKEWKEFTDRVCNPIGDSDSGLLFVYDELLETFPDSPILVIRRPVEEVHISLIKTLGYSSLEMLYRHDRTLDKLEKHRNTKTIYFDNLKEDSIRDAFNFLLPGQPWPKYRYELMSRMNIQLQEIDLDSVQTLDYFNLEGV